MPATPTQGHPRRSILLAGALLYLLLPNILFLAGWVQAWMAVPLCVLLVTAAWHLWKRTPMVPRTAPSRADKISLVVCLLLGAAFVYMMGFNGDFSQPRDFIVRNAIFETLVQSDWPLHSARGEYFVYYHAYWLPPAVLAKCVGSSVPSWLLLALWVYVGMALVIMCLHRRAKRHTFSLLVFLLGLACMKEWLEWVDVLARSFPKWQGLVDAYHALIPQQLYYIGMWFQLTTTYNHAVMVLLFLSMAYARLLPWHALLPASALVVVCSPLGASALLACLAAITVRHAKQEGVAPVFRHALLYADMVLLGVLGLYFAGGAGSHCVAAWKSPLFVGGLYSFLPAYLLGSSVMVFEMYAFGWRYRNTIAFRMSLVLLLALPWFWVGEDLNELFQKGSILPFFFMALFLHGTWRHSHAGGRRVLLILFAIAAYVPANDIQHRLREFGTSPQQHELNIRNEWHGHLNHPGHEWYARFWGPLAPPLFRK